MKKLLLAACFIFTLDVFALEYNPNTPLKLDPEIAIGQLDNGLTYYVYENDEPADVAYLYKNKLYGSYTSARII